MAVGRSFELMATVTASTKRRPAPSGGIIGAAETNISSLSCTPLDPVDPELRDMIPGLAGKGELLQAYIEGGLDIFEGDILVVDGSEYNIRAVGDWHWRADNENFVALILEEHE